MADSTPIEKLQPCLLDRLTDDEPEKKEESRTQRVISLQKYRRGVLRDLSWLFNSSAYLSLEGAESFNLKDFPEAYRSVINFGVRQLCGLTAPNMEKLQEELAAAVQTFEPRITAHSLIIHADMERNLVTLGVEGDLWAHPLPEHLYVKTEVDVETGQCLFGDSPYEPPTP
jgi:type VI secretion system protein ImpF